MIDRNSFTDIRTIHYLHNLILSLYYNIHIK